MNDIPDEDELLRGFEDGSWPLERWTHRAHLSVAWRYLVNHGLEAAIEHMSTGIQRYNAHHDLPDDLDRGYHHTLTVGWLHVLDGVMRTHGAGDSAAAFLEAQPYLLQRLLLRLYYSRPRIMSWEAKQGFVTPDLAAFPTPPPAGH